MYIKKIDIYMVGTCLGVLQHNHAESEMYKLLEKNK